MRKNSRSPFIEYLLFHSLSSFISPLRHCDCLGCGLFPVINVYFFHSSFYQQINNKLQIPLYFGDEKLYAPYLT
jgi:hypothetical protein